MLSQAPLQLLATLGPGRDPLPHRLRLSPLNSAPSGLASEAEDWVPLSLRALPSIQHSLI